MIIVSALDNSGQLHAAHLVRALRRRLANECFVGIGGNDLADAGCDLIHDISDNSAMLTGVVGALRWAVPAYRRLVKLMNGGDVRLVILVDSPTFNLPLARSAKKRGIKTFYYIAPQVWAWAQFRIRKIQRRVDRLAVVLPFEEKYFREFGVDAHFVGHPFIHRIKHARPDPALSEKLRALPGRKILLMPGSRRHVVDQLLPAHLRILRRVREQMGPLSAFITAWPTLTEHIADIVGNHDYRPVIDKVPDRPDEVAIFTDGRPALIIHSDLALAASGTGTLEVAWHGRPLIVTYNASRWVYHLIGRRLICTAYLSLINILAGRRLVPEFMPYIKDESDVARTAVELLSDSVRGESLGRELKDLLAQLDSPEDPAERTARLVLNLIGESGG